MCKLLSLMVFTTAGTSRIARGADCGSRIEQSGWTQLRCDIGSGVDCVRTPGHIDTARDGKQMVSMVGVMKMSLICRFTSKREATCE